jgi:hypothetical protein|nr:hypothetical protein [Kofleriaceae bacterium]
MTARFRETLWFKKGSLIGAEPADDDAPAASLGELPLDDRYLDDGSVTGDDTASFGVHTGATGEVPVIARTRTKRR